MCRWMLALALLASGQAMAATNVNVNCNVESDYDFSLTERSAIFTRGDGTPRAVLMRQGRLFVDDQWVTLNAADSKRVAEYEREARAMMPLLQKVGRDASEIAFAALGEVAVGFSNDPADTRARLAKVRTQLDARLARSVTARRFNSDDLGNGIRDAVRETLPTVMGDIVGGVVRAAFGGDTSRLQRMENMDKDIEARIGPRAKSLERNAQLLCTKMEKLDGIDNAFEYRLPNGTPLGLLRIKPDNRDKAE